jgi:hypothetical protein
MQHHLHKSLAKALLAYHKDYEIILYGEPTVVAPFMYKAIMRLAIFHGNATVTPLSTNFHTPC